MSCTCQQCGALFTMDLLVPDNIWLQIRPVDKPQHGGLLCPRCIVAAIEKMCGYCAFRLVEQKRDTDEH